MKQHFKRVSIRRRGADAQLGERGDTTPETASSKVEPPWLTGSVVPSADAFATSWLLALSAEVSGNVIRPSSSRAALLDAYGAVLGSDGAVSADAGRLVEGLWRACRLGPVSLRARLQAADSEALELVLPSAGAPLPRFAARALLARLQEDDTALPAGAPEAALAAAVDYLVSLYSVAALRLGGFQSEVSVVELREALRCGVVACSTACRPLDVAGMLRCLAAAWRRPGDLICLASLFKNAAGAPVVKVTTEVYDEVGGDAVAADALPASLLPLPPMPPTRARWPGTASWADSLDVEDYDLAPRYSRRNTWLKMGVLPPAVTATARPPRLLAGPVVDWQTRRTTSRTELDELLPFMRLLSVEDQPSLSWIAAEMRDRDLPLGCEVLLPSSTHHVARRAFERVLPQRPALLFAWPHACNLGADCDEVESVDGFSVSRRHPFQAVFEHTVALARIVQDNNSFGVVSQADNLLDAAAETWAAEYDAKVAAWQGPLHGPCWNVVSEERSAVDPRPRLLEEMRLGGRLVAFLRCFSSDASEDAHGAHNA